MELEEDGSRPEEPFPKPTVCPRCKSRAWDKPYVRTTKRANKARIRGRQTTWKDILKASSKE